VSLASIDALDGRVGPVTPKSFRGGGFDLQRVMDRVVDLSPPRAIPGGWDRVMKRNPSRQDIGRSGADKSVCIAQYFFDRGCGALLVARE
jgi:hypothetical protein